MADGKEGSIHATSDGGVSGKHPEPKPFEFLVGPTTTDQYNTARLFPNPIACWRVDDIRFAFDSSFVNADPTPNNPNDIRAELAHLVGLVKDHPGAPLSVFGHADPVGTDDYNKKLSGRRAVVIYGLLVANGDTAVGAHLWQQVAATEGWGKNQRQVMEQVTGMGSSTPMSTLIQSYIQNLCPRELKLTKKDFLAQGADPNGKGDYQGCSEFNPVLLFSKEDQAKYDQARQRNSKGDQATIRAQNCANAPNRRVLVLLFRKGSKVDPAKWPCPSASADGSGCKKRFWGGGPEGERRRNSHLSGKPRKFEEKEDTFGCRFYQRITADSPCHAVKPCEQTSFPPLNVNQPVTEVISGAPAPYTAWNNTYSWSSKFTVIVTRDPCQIRVIVKIKVNGSISDAQKTGWQSAIESKWTGKVTLYCKDANCIKACPDGYPVVINLEYVASGQHQIVNVKPTTLNMNNWSASDTVDVTHEFGHMLGNPEEYFTTNGVNYATTVNGVYYPFRSPNGSIMNNPANDPAPRHYDLIRQEAGKAMGINCSFDKPTDVGDFPDPGTDVATV